jgi:hypothetical protein
MLTNVTLAGVIKAIKLRRYVTGEIGPFTPLSTTEYGYHTVAAPTSSRQREELHFTVSLPRDNNPHHL